MICSIVLRISRTLICSKRLYGLLRHGKNQLEEGCVVRRQFVKVIDFLEGERSRFPGKRTAENDGDGRMGNEHLAKLVTGGAREEAVQDAEDGQGGGAGSGVLR